ncbi:MAG: peptidase S41, partial [Anaerolineales bacterium]
MLTVGLFVVACGGATSTPEAATAPAPTQPPTAAPTPLPPTEPPPPVPESADEPIQVSGTAEITFFLFDAYVSEPFVLLEDLAGFVNRDFEFEIAPADQIVGPLFNTSEDKWEYLLNLQAAPPGTRVDVDNNGQSDAGLQAYMISVQANLEDDPFLSRDEFRGWSTVWTSARIDSENEDEVSGGKLLVWAPDDQQQFPTGFGEDGLLFTADDPVAAIAAGYSIVDLDAEPFTFTKESHPDITLYEGDVAVNDYAAMSYTEAFDALWTKASAEYPFTDLKGIDWQALYDEFAPRVAEAEAADDYDAWYLAMRDFAWSIPDGHVGVQGDDGGRFQTETGGGLGLAVITWLVIIGGIR